MRCNSLLTLPLLLAAVTHAEEGIDGVAGHRRVGLGARDHGEAASAPQSLEHETEHVGRDRLLDEEDVESLSEDPFPLYEYEVMEGMDLMDGEDVFEDADLIDEDAEWDTADGYSNDYGEIEDFDSEYASRDAVDFYVEEGVGDSEGTKEGEGHDEKGEPKIVIEPIVRRLRRIIPVEEAAEEGPMDEVNALQMDEGRYLAEKMSLRDDSVPIFEPILVDGEEFDLTPYAEPEYLEELGVATADVGHRVLQSCGSGRTRFKVQVITDKSGWENRWVLKKANGAVVTRGPASGKNYGSSRQYIGGICLTQGTYRFDIFDKMKDGMCGNKTGKGLYRIYLNGNKKFTSPAQCSRNWGQRTHTFQVKGNSNNRPNSRPNNNRPSNNRPNNNRPSNNNNWQSRMSSRDRQWLNAHNSRRRKYNGGKGYVAMKWSRNLATASKRYAEQLARNCRGSLKHARGIPHGENLAKNIGSGSWGQLYSADRVMKRWVEDELRLPYPRNGHYTQVVWRASRYVGCGESVRRLGAQTCRIQVCRYARPGNCNVRNGNWRSEAWKNDTPCGPRCPPEGCF